MNKEINKDWSQDAGFQAAVIEEYNKRRHVFALDIIERLAACMLDEQGFLVLPSEQSAESLLSDASYYVRAYKGVE